jgi:integrase/recombinase XerD
VTERALSLEALSRRFIEWLLVSHYSPETAKTHGYQLARFIAWCAARSIVQPDALTRAVLEAYVKALYYYRKKDGKPLSRRSQASLFESAVIFVHWLTREGHLTFDPSATIEHPRAEKTLSGPALTEDEAERALNGIDVSTPLGVRDRAMLELLYATGMRRVELVGLRVADIDRERETALIRHGKGGKERVVPIGERALEWLERYLAEVRPSLVREPDDGALFLSRRRTPVNRDRLTMLVRRHLVASGFTKRGAAHVFRHTAATLMLENGADLRMIQELLGHAYLSSTQVYTKVSIEKLKEVHTKTHPAKLPSALDGDDAGDGD